MNNIRWYISSLAWVRRNPCKIPLKFPIDHSIDSELGIVHTKGAFLGISGYCEGWAFCTRNEHGKIFDYLIIYCANNNIIEKIFIIPNIEIVSRTGFWISKNYLKGWYEKYRIKDTETIKKMNHS